MKGRDHAKNADTSGSLFHNFELLSRQSEEVEKTRRSDVVRALSQVHELTPALSALNQGDKYHVVLSRPASGWLNRRADGMLDAFVKSEDGKIVAVARLQKASSALLSSATALAGHAMLVQISAQIERLQGAVDQVLAKMEAERLGKVDAALAFLIHRRHYRSEHQVPMLRNAAQTLSEVLAGALRDVEQGIAVIPEPQEWNLTRAIWDTTGRTAEALDRVAGSMRVVLLCLKALGQVQLQLNDEIDAANILGDWLRNALNIPLARPEFLARRLPVVTEDERRDRFWIDVKHGLERALEKVGDALNRDVSVSVEFDMKGKQLIAY